MRAHLAQVARDRETLDPFDDTAVEAAIARGHRAKGTATPRDRDPGRASVSGFGSASPASAGGPGAQGVGVMR